MRSLLLLALVFGCSAIVNPDGTRLGGGEVDVGRDAGTDGGLDGGGVDANVDSGCTAAPFCDGATRIFCAGGRLQMEDCDDGCDPDSGSCIGAPTDFQPSNVGRDQFREDAPDLVLDPPRSGRYDTSECDPASGIARVVRLADSSEACVLSLGDFVIEEGTTFQVIGDRALIVVSSGEIRIDGVLDASAEGTRPGPGGFRGGEMDGQGPGGGGAGQHRDRFSDGGGGGGGACGIGGAGGVGGGLGMDAPGGRPGPAWAALGADFQPLIGGSAGGRGQGALRDGGATNAGLGGAGGGAIQLTALDRVRVTGTLVVGGGGGQGGQAVGGTGVNWGSGGGGGSGGTVLLEAPVVQSTGIISLAGGGGGGFADGRSGTPGSDGPVDGRASGGSPGGGAGAGDTSVAGTLGDDGSAPAANGAGGGGGGGCLVIRSASPPAAGRLNPSMSRPTLLPLRP